PVGSYGKGVEKAASSFREAGVIQDRKSTRLNSSHASTSYAVSCLKKKTRRQRPPNWQTLALPTGPMRPKPRSKLPATAPRKQAPRLPRNRLTRPTRNPPTSARRNPSRTAPSWMKLTPRRRPPTSSPPTRPRRRPRRKAPVRAKRLIRARLPRRSRPRLSRRTDPSAHHAVQREAGPLLVGPFFAVELETVVAVETHRPVIASGHPQV